MSILFYYCVVVHRRDRYKYIFLVGSFDKAPTSTQYPFPIRQLMNTMFFWQLTVKCWMLYTKRKQWTVFQTLLRTVLLCNDYILIPFSHCVRSRCTLLRAARHVVWAATRLPDLCVVHERHPRLHGGSQAGGQSVRLVPQPDTAHSWRRVATGTSPCPHD